MCAACLGQLPPVDKLCYRCQRPSPDSLTCSACRQASPLRSARTVTTYAGGARALIWELKFSGAQSAARIMARRLAVLVEKNAAPNTVIVPVPTATGRARRRGYDQAKLLARALSQVTRLPCRNYLVRGGQTHQHQLSRHARLQQLDGAFRAHHPRLVKDAHVILVDDVITTGATIEAAAMVLSKAGAVKIDAVAFARPA